MLKVDLVIIDPQNDFMGNDDGSPYTVTLRDGKTLTAALPVQGAVSDMKRLSLMVDRLTPRLNDIHVTLDSHRVVDVGHPAMWRDQYGNFPAPFTIISVADIEAGIWSPRYPGYQTRMLSYARSLESQGNYPLMVWPLHCLIGSWGHNIQEDLGVSLRNWESTRFANVDFVVKGTNAFTEHYGALKAEVEDPEDPSTQLNTSFLTTLQEADIVGLAGEASSHCVLSTVKQIADNIGADHLKKLYLLTDCMSPVAQVPGGPDFPDIADNFLHQMESLGMHLTTSVEFLK